MNTNPLEKEPQGNNLPENSSTLITNWLKKITELVSAYFSIEGRNKLEEIMNLSAKVFGGAFISMGGAFLKMPEQMWKIFGSPENLENINNIDNKILASLFIVIGVGLSYLGTEATRRFKKEAGHNLESSKNNRNNTFFID